MAKEPVKEQPAAEVAGEKEQPAAGVKVVIMQDGVFSSIGVHNKGEKPVLSEYDVKILEEKGLATRVG